MGKYIMSVTTYYCEDQQNTLKAWFMTIIPGNCFI